MLTYVFEIISTAISVKISSQKTTAGFDIRCALRTKIDTKCSLPLYTQSFWIICCITADAGTELADAYSPAVYERNKKKIFENLQNAKKVLKYLSTQLKLPNLILFSQCFHHLEKGHF